MHTSGRTGGTSGPSLLPLGHDRARPPRPPHSAPWFAGRTPGLGEGVPVCAVKGAGRTGRGEGGRGLLGRPAGTQPRSLAVPAQSSPSVAPGRWAALGRRSARTARWSQAVSTGPLPGRTFPGRPGFCGPQAHGDMEFGLPRPPECTLWCMPLCAHPCVWPVPPAPETEPHLMSESRSGRWHVSGGPAGSLGAPRRCGVGCGLQEWEPLA